MRRRQSRVCVGGWCGRQEQPASLDREKSGWDRKDVAGVCRKTGKAGYLYYKEAAAAIAAEQVLGSARGKMGKGQDGLGTVKDMVGGRRVSRNISPPC